MQRLAADTCIRIAGGMVAGLPVSAACCSIQAEMKKPPQRQATSRTDYHVEVPKRWEVSGWRLGDGLQT